MRTDGFCAVVDGVAKSAFFAIISPICEHEPVGLHFAIATNATEKEWQRVGVRCDDDDGKAREMVIRHIGERGTIVIDAWHPAAFAFFCNEFFPGEGSQEFIEKTRKVYGKEADEVIADAAEWLKEEEQADLIPFKGGACPPADMRRLH
jgi:hypothetical protein